MERSKAHRLSPEQRGYGGKWRLNRGRFLAAHPRCVLCAGKATVPDHYPVSRNMLLAQGVPNPDSWVHLRPLCASCHGRETQRNQRSGWNARN